MSGNLNKECRAWRKKVRQLSLALEYHDYQTIDLLVSYEPRLVMGWGNDIPLLTASIRFEPEFISLTLKYYHPEESEEKKRFADLCRYAEEKAQLAWFDYFAQGGHPQGDIWERYTRVLEKLRRGASLAPLLGKSG